MSRHGSYYGNDAAGSAVGLLIVIAVIAAVIAAYILVRVLAYCMHTFVKFPREKSLWISLSICVLLTLVGGSVSHLTSNAAWGSGACAVGVFQQFVTCIVVQRQHATTCLPESTSIREQILEHSWWRSTETPFAV